MIYVISKSTMEKDIKLIAKSADYTIINGTRSSKIKNMRTGDDTFNALIPNSILLKPDTSDSIYENKLKKFLSAPKLKETLAIIAVSVVDDPGTNVFVVLTDKCYKRLGKKIRNRILKVFHVDHDDNDLVFMYDDIKDLGRSLEKRNDAKLEEIDEKIEKLRRNGENKKLEKLRDKRFDLYEDIDEMSNKKIRRTHMSTMKISKKSIKGIKRFLKKYEAYHKAVIS